MKKVRAVVVRIVYLADDVEGDMDDTEHRGGPAVWWCNQGATYRQSKATGSLWAPLRTKRGQTQRHWDLLEKVNPGDVVVIASDQAVRALGRATSRAYPATSPWQFTGFRSDMYNPQGRCVNIEMFELQEPVPVKELSTEVVAQGPERGPFNKVERLRQAYLTPFSVEGLRILRALSSEEWPAWARHLVETRDR